MFKVVARLTWLAALTVFVIIGSTKALSHRYGVLPILLAVERQDNNGYWYRTIEFYDTPLHRSFSISTSATYGYRDSAAVCEEWSPDRHWLFYCVEGTVYLLETETMRQARVLQVDEEVKFKLLWSPDSRFLLFYLNDGDLSLRLFDMTTGSATELPTPALTIIQYPSYSEFDGQWVSNYFLYTGESTAYAVYPTGELVELGNIIPNRAHFSPDKRYVVFEKETEPVTLLLFDSLTRQIHALGNCDTYWQGRSFCSDPRWSANYFTYQNGGTQLVRVDGTPVNSFLGGEVTWSPDGTKFAIDASYEGLAIVDVASGQVIDLLTEYRPYDEEISPVVWSNDSRYILFSDTREEYTPLVIYDTLHKTQRIIPVENTIVVDIHYYTVPDSANFLYQINEGWTGERVKQIFMLSPELDSQPQLLWEEPPGDQQTGPVFLRFDDPYLLFSTGYIQSDIQTELYITNLHTGKTHQVLTGAFMLQSCGFEIPLLSIDQADVHFDFRGLYKIDLATGQLEEWFARDTGVVCPDGQFQP